MYNQNAGYGKGLINSLPFRGSGKIFVVGDSSTANIDMLKQVFDVDADAKVRFFSTIDAAVSVCTANASDLILVMPGHSETISSATALVLDVAGVHVLGLGHGTDRPTLTFDTTTAATIPVSVNNGVFENFIFSANFADIVAAFTLTTAKNLLLKDCEFKASATNMNFLSLVDTSTTNNAADGLKFDNVQWVEPDAATLYAVKGDADIDGLTFKGGYYNLGVNTSDLPALVNMATGKDVTNLHIDGPRVIRLNDANPLLVVTDTTTANTGVIENVRVRHADTAGELLVTAGTKIGFFDNKGTAADDASGYLLPGADS